MELVLKRENATLESVVDDHRKGVISTEKAKEIIEDMNLLLGTLNPYCLWLDEHGIRYDQGWFDIDRHVPSWFKGSTWSTGTRTMKTHHVERDPTRLSWNEPKWKVEWNLEGLFNH